MLGFSLWVSWGPTSKECSVIAPPKQHGPCHLSLKNAEQGVTHVLVREPMYMFPSTGVGVGCTNDCGWSWDTKSRWPCSEEAYPIRRVCVNVETKKEAALNKAHDLQKSSETHKMRGTVDTCGSLTPLYGASSSHERQIQCFPWEVILNRPVVAMAFLGRKGFQSGGTIHHSWASVASRVAVSGHVPCTSQEAERDGSWHSCVVSFLFYSVSPGLQNMECYDPLSEWIFSPRLTPSGNTLTYMPGGVSPG